MSKIQIEISVDEAIVLFEFFEKFDKKEEMYFAHPAEYLALMKISGQINKSTSAMFKENYVEILKKASENIAEGFESDFPEIREE